MGGKRWGLQDAPRPTSNGLRVIVLTKLEGKKQVLELVAPSLPLSPIILPNPPLEKEGITVPLGQPNTQGHAWSLGEAMRFSMKALAEKGPGFYKLFWDGHKIIWAAGYRYSNGQVWTSWHGKPGNLRGVFDLARWAVWVHERFSHDVGLLAMIPFVLALGVIKAVKNILHPIRITLRLALTPTLSHRERGKDEGKVISKPFSLASQQMLAMENALNEIISQQPEDAKALLGTLLDSSKPGPLMLDALGNPLLGLASESEDELLRKPLDAEELDSRFRRSGMTDEKIANSVARNALSIAIDAWQDKFKEEPSRETAEQITALYGKARAHGTNGNVLRAHLILFYAFQKAILGEQGLSWPEMLRSYETGESVRRQIMMNEAPEIDNEEVLLVNLADFEYAPESMIGIVKKRITLLPQGTPDVADLVLTDGFGRDFDPEAFKKMLKYNKNFSNLEKTRIRFHKVSFNGVDVNELHEKLGYKARGVPLAALIVDIKRGNWNVVSAIANELIRLIQVGEHDLFDLKTYIGKELKNARVILEQA